MSSQTDLQAEQLRALPVGTLVRDVDGDVWRIEYAVIEGVEQAVARLIKPNVELVRTLERVTAFGPFSCVRGAA